MAKTNNLIKEYEKKHQRAKSQKIILIIIIIILILLWLVSWKLGKIGYDKSYDNSTPVFNEQVEIIKVSDNTSEITNNTDLNIFANVKFNDESIIAPKSSGEYKFIIENISTNPLQYSINFTDLMSNPINMKYRLKIDNVYIRGNASEYINIEELKVEDIIVMEDSNNIFTLEWFWEDNDPEDTYVGSLTSTEYYTLNLTIQAEAYMEK